MVTPIIEGIDNEVLLVFGVLVAVVAILMVQYVYRSTGQSIQNTSSESTNFDSSHSDGPTQQREVLYSEVNAEPVTPGCSQTASPSQSNSYAEGISAAHNPSEPQEGDVSSEGIRRRLVQNLPRFEGQTSPPSNQITIRIKYMENERTISVHRTITVGEFKRLCFPDEMNSGRRVRLIYSGCLLQDDNAAISYYGVDNLSVIHTQISNVRRDQEQPTRQTQETDLDISRLFLPLLAVILMVSWYGMLYHRHLFSVTSIVILVFVTVAYGLLVHVMLS